MFDHIGIKVADLDASVRFYEAALAPLGHALCYRDDTSAGFGPKDAPALWLYVAPKKPATTTHIAFRAPNHAAIAQFHAKGLRAGGRDNGPPGARPDYTSTYHAGFLLDPDGHNVEAVCP